MRLSLIISVTLLFGSALAIPAPMEGESPSPPPGGGSGKGKERAKSTTPPEQGGSQGSDPSSESTDAGLGFTGGPNKGFGSVATKYFHPDYPDGDISGLSRKQRKAQNLDYAHPARILGKDNEDPSKVQFTPMSHDFKDNPGIHNPVPAAHYGIRQGPNLGDSMIHTGAPMKTSSSNVKMFDTDRPDAFSIGKHDSNRLNRDMARNMQQLSISGGGGGAGEGRRSPPRRDTAPGSLGREPEPQERGGRSGFPDPSRARGRSRSQSPPGLSSGRLPVGTRHTPYRGDSPSSQYRSRSPLRPATPERQSSFRAPRRQQTYAGSTEHSRGGASHETAPPPPPARRDSSRSRSPSGRRN